MYHRKVKEVNNPLMEVFISENFQSLYTQKYMQLGFVSCQTSSEPERARCSQI